MEIKEYSRTKVYLFIIILSSVLTHFLFFGQPQETVFDEVHFGKFMSGYLTREYFFDIHPPLGKLMISGAGYLTGFEPGFSFAEIGQKFPDRHYLSLRLLPIIAGILLSIAIFFLILQLGMSRLAAFAGGMLIVLENAILVQSRFILLDAFLLFFGFLALLFYFKFRNSFNNGGSHASSHLLFAGIFAALAASVKWTGLTFLVIIVVFYFIDWLKSNKKIGMTIKGPAFLVAVPILIYFSIFALHFSLLSKTGTGDAFMTPAFRKTLTGSTDNTNPDIVPLNIFGKFTELNAQMYKSNATLTASHPYSSYWFTWPFMIRPIYYWYGGDSNQQPASPKLQRGEQTTSDQAQKIGSRIYFLGNPVVWFASTLAILFLILKVVGRTLTGWRNILDLGTTKFLLAGGFLLNMLPFIGIKRAMFLYHYLIGLVFAIIALVYFIDQMKNKKRIFLILLAMSLAAFIFFAPLSYGLPLTEKAYNARVWLKTWL